MLFAQADGLIASNPSDVVFQSSTGTLWNRKTCIAGGVPHETAAGFSWVTPHTFRRGVATAIGIDNIRAAADELGHADTAVTQRHYVAKTHEGPDARSVLEPFG